MIGTIVCPATWAKNKARIIYAAENPEATWERLRTSGALWEEALALFGEAGAETAIRILRLFRRCGIGDDVTRQNVAKA